MDGASLSTLNADLATLVSLSSLSSSLFSSLSSSLYHILHVLKFYTQTCMYVTCKHTCIDADTDLIWL